MESNILTQLSREIGIAPELIVREEWEMKILAFLSESKIGQFLVFKGGTALRLAYNSPRFSEDLDFDISDNFSFSEFEKTIKNLAEKYNLEIKDLAKKFYTYLAQIKIVDENTERNFSIKIEISTRKVRGRDYAEPKLIVSPSISLQALMQVSRLENIKKEKETAVKTRRQSRDLFDLWYICQLNREPWKVPKNDFSLREIKSELNKFLPLKYQKIIKELQYEK